MASIGSTLKRSVPAFLAATLGCWPAPVMYQKQADGIIVTPQTGPVRRVRLQVISERIVRVTAAPV